MLRISSLSLLAAATLASSYTAPEIQIASNATTESKLIPSILTSRDDKDPADFGWIKRWAAIGDSYTAGIGSGRQLGGIFHNRDDWYCSRYDQAYPVVVNKAFGSAVEKFQFEACSGDRSVQIYDQVQKMDGDLDLVIMTAGGNDLCLAAMLKACIFLPFQGEDKCQGVIDQATKNIDTILKPNIRQILASLNSKMRKDSVVVYNGYAQFFNTDNDVCTNDENWTLKFKWFIKGLKLTIDRRKKFNDLVVGINGAIRDVVNEFSSKGSLNYKIAFADWDRWPREGVDGQFCHPSSSGHYPDDKQPNLQFFKEDTYVEPIIHDELKRRSLQDKEEAEFQAWLKAAEEENIYNTLLFKSADPRAEVLHKLDRRAPAPPNCPGDGSFDPTLGLGLPDTFGKLFHPNELGHATIASYALQTVMDLRAEVLGVDAPACTIEDKFTCYQKDGRKAYAHPDQLNENYKDFCKNVVVPEHTKGWEYKKTYFEGTPDEQQFKISLGDAMDYNEKECLDSMDRIINGCDGNDDKNPMDWKFGGEWKRGEYTYEVAPQRDNRPWPVIQKPDGHCKGNWKALFSSYTIYGVGFSDYDYGQKTILPAMKGCLGLGITKWKFDYYDKPTDDGWEWKLTFNTPVFVNARCFKNNKVVKSAGGWTNGCGGSDA